VVINQGEEAVLRKPGELGREHGWGRFLSSLPSPEEDSPLPDTESIDLLLFPAAPPNITHAGFGQALHGRHNTPV